MINQVDYLLRLPKELRDDFKKAVTMNGTTVAEELRRFMRRYVAKNLK